MTACAWDVPGDGPQEGRIVPPSHGSSNRPSRGTSHGQYVIPFIFRLRPMGRSNV